MLSNGMLVAQYLGGSTLGERGEKLFEELCRLWPLGSVSADSLRKVAAVTSAARLGLQMLVSPCCSPRDFLSNSRPQDRHGRPYQLVSCMTGPFHRCKPSSLSSESDNLFYERRFTQIGSERRQRPSTRRGRNRRQRAASQGSRTQVSQPLLFPVPEHLSAPARRNSQLHSCSSLQREEAPL